jgi:hypothetical protein
MNPALLSAAVAIALAWTGPAGVSAPDRSAKKKPDPQAEKVRQAIQDGIKYLRGKQLKDGSWEIDCFGKMRYQGGWTCMALLALLNAGVPANDKAVERGLAYLRKQKTEYTYVRALQTMVLATAGQKQDKQRIQANVDWLVKIRLRDEKKLLGWTYNSTQRQAPDNSNTHYAIMGLEAGRLAGAKVPKEVWQEIRDFYLRTQLPKGGWIYARHHNPNSYLTMDVAGVCGLLASGQALGVGQEIPQKGGKLQKGGGKTKGSREMLRALKYISEKQYEIDFKDAVFYNLYGLSRLGRLSGLRYFGKHDWYREGCDLLIKLQSRKKEDYGCWPTQGIKFDHWALVNTSFALLFLSKGRSPVPIK